MRVARPHSEFATGACPMPTSNGFSIGPMVDDDLGEISALHSAVFGPGRFARTAYRIREGGRPMSVHCRVAREHGSIVGAVSFTAVDIGDVAGHWLLGPLSIRPDAQDRGLGKLLIETAIESVSQNEPAQATVILIGDRAYYGRYGFEPVPPRRIMLPGPVDAARLLIWRGPEGKRAIPDGLVKGARYTVFG